MYDECWEGYRKVPGKKRGEKGSCEKIPDKKKESSAFRPGRLSKHAKQMDGYTQHGNIKGKKRNEIYEAVRDATGNKSLAAAKANSYDGKSDGVQEKKGHAEKVAAIWDMLKKPLVAGGLGAALGGTAGWFGGREHLQESAEGPFVAMMQPEQFVPSLLQGMDPAQQQAIMSDPYAMQMLTNQVRGEAAKMLGEQVLD
jgi:hypothetical protein